VEERRLAAAVVIAHHGTDSPEAAQLVTEMVESSLSSTTPAEAAHLREAIARHGHLSWEVVQLLVQRDYVRMKTLALAAPAAASEPQSFVPSEEWAKENSMRTFVPKLTEAARCAADGRDPTSQTSAARSGFVLHGTPGPMSHFFSGGGGDTCENATDRAAWVAETTSGEFDCDWKPSEHAVRSAPDGAGSMCPVEYGGSHVGTTDPVVDTFTAPEETTVLDAAAAAKCAVNVAAFDYVFAPGLVLAHLVELLLPGRMQDGGQSLVQFALTCKGICNDVDVQHALASIRGVAEMRAVALDASVRNYFGKAFFSDDMSHTVYRLIETNTLIDEGPAGDTLPVPPGMQDIHTWEGSLRFALEHGLLDEENVEFSDSECE
jgi:hypothetical protein